MAGFVTLDQAVAFATSTIKEPTDKERLYFQEWAYQAQREIGPSKMDLKTSEPLTVEDLKIRKPSDLIGIEDASFFNVDDAELKYVHRGWGQRIHNATTDLWNYIEISEDGNFLYLSSNGDNVRYAILKYWVMPLDEQGLPQIPENHLMATESYIRWMWSKRQNVNQSEIAQNRLVWLQEAAKARGADKMPDMWQAHRIATVWQSMIDKALTNIKYQF